jgi:hypothetical protein
LRPIIFSIISDTFSMVYSSLEVADILSTFGSCLTGLVKEIFKGAISRCLTWEQGSLSGLMCECDG